VARRAGPAPTVCRGGGWRRGGCTGRCGDDDPGWPLRAPGHRRLRAGGLRQHTAAVQRNRQPAQQPAGPHRTAGRAPVPPATGSFGRRAAQTGTSAATSGARPPNPPNPASPPDPAEPIASGQAHTHQLHPGPGPHRFPISGIRAAHFHVNGLAPVRSLMRSNCAVNVSARLVCYPKRSANAHQRGPGPDHRIVDCARR
jgi:hypothetical protein